MSTTAIVILVVVLVAVLFAAGWFFGGQARSKRLRNRFGPEYDRHLEEAGDRRTAERELAEREKRHAQLELRELSPEAHRRYTEEWARVQERFVDEPRDAVVAGDELVHSVMSERGYPMDGFDQQVADLSVEHATVVSNYRDGHQIRSQNEQSTTEDLRQALVHYRTVLDELLGKTAAHGTDDKATDTKATDSKATDTDDHAVDHTDPAAHPADTETHSTPTHTTQDGTVPARGTKVSDGRGSVEEEPHVNR